jgi:hypothetical protein
MVEFQHPSEVTLPYLTSEGDRPRRLASLYCQAVLVLKKGVFSLLLIKKMKIEERISGEVKRK